jgi:2-C-methyl-D-erythritol 4-phosphate cytidylyltransferase/2-C-methyl-D-erythritol 2,4-cyclodiphosphate synthase
MGAVAGRVCSMHVVAIIAAGGRGERLGAGVPKPLVEIGGRSILERSVALFDRCDRVHEIVVVVPPELREERGWAAGVGKPLRIVAGGARRQDSVANGFAAAGAGCDIVVVHDAARPFASVDLIARTIDAAAECGAALAAIPARDTIKLIEAGAVSATIPRERVRLAQTPQAFRRDVLARAIEAGAGAAEATDEASLAERAGFSVALVEGERTNIKITTADDLELARVMTGGGPALLRIGTGYDLHRLVADRPLILGGVTIPFDRGLAGHSDADAICHAVTDAVLGAANAGDIGRHFPDTDARWAGASSLLLLREATALVRARGYRVANVDVVVIAERPKLAPFIDRIAASVAAALGVEPSAVSVKGKTNEGVGEIGRGEAIAAHAVALLTRA